MFKDSPTAGHFSFKSCLGLNDLFKSMFKDSPTAGHFPMSKTKCSYLINYGLTPYFKDNPCQGYQFISLF